MRQLMVRGDEHLTELGRPLALADPADLAPTNCNAEGINVRHHLRFGILGNEQTTATRRTRSSGSGAIETKSSPATLRSGAGRVTTATDAPRRTVRSG